MDLFQVGQMKLLQCPLDNFLFPSQPRELSSPLDQVLLKGHLFR